MRYILYYFLLYLTLLVSCTVVQFQKGEEFLFHTQIVNVAGEPLDSCKVSLVGIVGLAEADYFYRKFKYCENLFDSEVFSELLNEYNRYLIGQGKNFIEFYDTLSVQYSNDSGMVDISSQSRTNLTIDLNTSNNPVYYIAEALLIQKKEFHQKVLGLRESCEDYFVDFETITLVPQ